MPSAVSVERVRHITLQVGARLFLSLARRAAVHLEQQLAAPARRVDARGDERMVQRRRHRLADDPRVDDAFRRVREIVRLEPLLIGGNLVRPRALDQRLLAALSSHNQLHDQRLIKIGRAHV